MKHVALYKNLIYTFEAFDAIKTLLKMKKDLLFSYPSLRKIAVTSPFTIY